MPLADDSWALGALSRQSPILACCIPDFVKLKNASSLQHAPSSPWAWDLQPWVCWPAIPITLEPYENNHERGLEDLERYGSRVPSPHSKIAFQFRDGHSTESCVRRRQNTTQQ